MARELDNYNYVEHSGLVTHTQRDEGFVYPTAVVPPKSKALGSNPKDLLGSKKPSITKVPSVAILHETLAMMDGAEKYGPYNWRDNKVVASIYVDACMRHLMQWFEGEELASDSHVHHLGHARACLGILLDALETGNLIDDRPVNERTSRVASKVIERLTETIAAKKAEKEAQKEKLNAANSCDTQTIR